MAQPAQQVNQVPRVISTDDKYKNKALELWKLPVSSLESNNFHEWNQALMAMTQVAQLKWTVDPTSPVPNGLSTEAKRIILSTVSAFIRQKTDTSIQYKLDESKWQLDP